MKRAQKIIIKYKIKEVRIKYVEESDDDCIDIEDINNGYFGLCDIRRQ